MTSKLGVDLPYTDKGTANWRNIIIEEGEVQYNANGKPLYRQCELSRPSPNKYGYYPKTVYSPCGGDALYIVTRTSQLTDKTYTSYTCEVCAREWISPNA